MECMKSPSNIWTSTKSLLLHALSSFHSLLFSSFSSYFSYFRKLATGQHHLTSSAVQLSSEIDKKRNGNGRRGPTSEDVENMINDLKGKTTREKLEVFLCSFFPSSILSLLLFYHLQHPISPSFRT